MCNLKTKRIVICARKNSFSEVTETDLKIGHLQIAMTMFWYNNRVQI